jgi:hypothetical protein
MYAVLIALSLLPLTTGADAQMVPSQSAPVQAASVPATAESTLAFARAPRAEGAIVITIVRGDGPDLTQALAPNAPGWQGPLPADWVRITCLGERAVCLSIDRGATDEALVRLTAYPRATLTATWPATVAGQAVRVMVSRQTEAGDSAFGPTRGQWSVPTRADGRFSLDVPQGTLDIRLVASGCAAVYRFDVKAGATTALGPLPCVPGGSIAARVRDSQSGDTVASCVATVRPSGALVATESTRRFAQMVAQSATCNAFGFFQVTGLPQGRYQVTTETGAHAPNVTEVDVPTDTETSADLWLTPFRSLTVRVSPPVAPDGLPWTLRLRPTDVFADPTQGWARATVGPSGEVRFTRVTPADHEVEVFTQDEQQVTAMLTPLPAGDAALVVAIPLVRVIGRVMQGTRPAGGASVELSDRHNQQHFTTDDDGRFSGWIRRPADDEMRFLSAFVSPAGTRIRTAPPVATRFIDEQTLEVELSMGWARMFVRVMNSAGLPVDQVRVNIAGAPTTSSPSPGAPLTASGAVTDATGTAVFEGLEGGRYYVYGTHHTGSVKTTTVDVPAEGESALSLELTSTSRHAFEVVSDQGVPQADTAVAIKSDTVMTGSRGRTDGLGQVLLDIAEASRRSVLTVWADSQMLWSGCVPINERDRTRIILPPPSTGLLRLVRGREGAGNLFVVGDRGGVFRTADLVAWRRTKVNDLADASVYEIPGLAVGRYRVLQYDSLDPTPLVQAACAGAISFDDPSAGTLTPGGVLELRWPTPK